MSKVKRFGYEFELSEEKIFLDSATIGKLPSASLDAMTKFYKEIGGAAVRSVNQESTKSEKILETARKTVRDFFNAKNSHISFFPTREVTLTNALFSLEDAKEKRIITSILEEHSLLAPAVRLHNTTGTAIDYLKIEDEVNLADTLSKRITGKNDIVLLSSLTVTNGVKRNWKEISKICKDTGSTFILDISQSVGHEEIDFSAVSPDIVISSGCIGALGPQGTAFQIITDKMYDVMDPLLVGGGSVIALEEYLYILERTDSKFEPGILNVAGISSLAKSLEILSDIGLEKIEKHEVALNEYLRSELENFSDISLMKIEGTEQGPILSFGSDRFEAHDIAIILEDMNNIVVRSGALCSHLFMYELKYNDLVRVSTHLYNTLEEVKIFIETMNKVFSTI